MKRSSLLSSGILSSGILSSGILSSGILSSSKLSLGNSSLGRFSSGILSSGILSSGILFSGKLSLGNLSPGQFSPDKFSRGNSLAANSLPATSSGGFRADASDRKQVQIWSIPVLSVWFVQRRLQTRCGVRVRIPVARSASWFLALGAVCVRAPGLWRGLASGLAFGRGLRPGRL